MKGTVVMCETGRIRWVVPGYVSLAIIGLVMIDPATAIAGKPQKPPADDTSQSPGVRFDDVILLDNVQSDLQDGDRTYYDDREAKVSVSFSQDGHLVLDTNASNKTNVGRSLYIDFGESIKVIDSEGQERSFQSTEDLVDEENIPIPHDAEMQVGGFQDDFDMLTMAVGETRNDVNLVIYLFIYFPDIRHETGLMIGLAPEPVDNDRYCPGSDPVSVTYLGDTDDDGLVEWRIEPCCVDDDGDGEIDEDPIDGLDNDGDGKIDEDWLGGLASVSQNPFASDPVTVGHLPFTFGITVLAPAP